MTIAEKAKIEMWKRQFGESCYDPMPLTRIALLREMAANNIWPDGSFGDADCNVWSMFYNFKIMTD